MTADRKLVLCLQCGGDTSEGLPDQCRFKIEFASENGSPSSVCGFTVPDKVLRDMLIDETTE